MGREKVVVFGGSGFLGSHVADALSDRGYEVYVYDVRPSPYIREDQTMVEGSILDTDKVLSTIRGAKYVYNFAGITDISEASNRPVDTIRINVLGHSVVLDACRRAGVERILLASSVYVYSRYGSFYRVSKQACESLTEAFYERYGLKYTIMRYGSLYGPRAQSWNGVYRYVYQAIVNRKIECEGTGEERREFIHVLDAAKLSVDLLSPEFENECVVITGTQSLTLKELFVMISEMLSGKVEIVFKNGAQPHHYAITPYSFSPKLAKKVVANSFVDLGEGILQIMKQIFEESAIQNTRTAGPE